MGDCFKFLWPFQKFWTLLNKEELTILWKTTKTKLKAPYTNTVGPLFSKKNIKKYSSKNSYLWSDRCIIDPLQHMLLNVLSNMSSKNQKNLKDFWLLDQIGPNYTNFRIFRIYYSGTFFPTVWCWWLLPLLTDCDRKEHEINNPTFVTNNTTIFRTKLLPSPSLRFSIEHQSYSY